MYKKINIIHIIQQAMHEKIEFVRFHYPISRDRRPESRPSYIFVDYRK